MNNTIIEKCARFSFLGKSNILILNAHADKITGFNTFAVPKFIEEEFRKNSRRLLEKYSSMKKNQIIMFKDKLKMSYLIKIIKDSRKKEIFISFGPFIDEEIEKDDIKFLGHNMKLSSENILILQNLYSKIPILNNEEMSYMADILKSFLVDNISNAKIIKDIVKTQLPKQNKYSSKFEQYDFVEQNYKKENEILNSIEIGP